MAKEDDNKPPDREHDGKAGKPDNKITITVIYNGAPMPLEVNPKQALQAVLQHALQTFGLTAGPVLLTEDNQQLDLSQSVKDAGLVEGSRIVLRPVESIWVNEDQHEFRAPTIAYAEVVALYLGDGGAQSAEYVVKYSKGPPQNVKGTLAPGQKVEVKNDMRFRVSGTGES